MTGAVSGRRAERRGAEQTQAFFCPKELARDRVPDPPLHAQTSRGALLAPRVDSPSASERLDLQRILLHAIRSRSSRSFGVAFANERKSASGCMPPRRQSASLPDRSTLSSDGDYLRSKVRLISAAAPLRCRSVARQQVKASQPSRNSKYLPWRRARAC